MTGSASVGADDDKMPLRISTSKRDRLGPEEPSGRRRRSSLGAKVAFEGVDDEKDEYDSRFVSTSPVISPAAGGQPTWTGPVSSVQRPLSSCSWTEFDLLHHLQRIPEKHEDTATALGDVFRQRDELTVTTLFSLDPEILDVSDESSLCEVYEIYRDGSVIPRFDSCVDTHNEGLDWNATWALIKEVNVKRKSVGRITILQQPSAISLAGIHMTMTKGRHFDMDELFSQLVSNKSNRGKTAAHVLRAFEPQPIHQRTFFFVFKYYTVADEGLKPAPWQKHDIREPDEEVAEGIDISECGSIVALSLEGDAVNQVPRRASKSNRMRIGSVYETFAPFHVLNIQCSPDFICSDRDMAENPCHSGPQAFLECLAAEYRTAGQRLWRLHDRIGELVIPHDQFIFDLKTRDKLLFEDGDFTYSRRYFWAYNTLAMVNDSIRSMMNAYNDSFTPEFWLGNHPTLWPHPDPDSAEGCNYLDQLGRLRQELEWSIKSLRTLVKANELLRREIENLREQLYSGSAVKENRTTIEQGENIKILTGVSMLFMPLSFVTSLFGMTEFQVPPTDWRFVVVVLTVCVPFFVFVFMLQTDVGASILRGLRFSSHRQLDKWERRARERREKRSQLQQAAMIRKQSCAPVAAGAGRRESSWTLDVGSGPAAGGGRGAMTSLKSLGSRARGWGWPARRREGESSPSQKDSNV